MPFVSPWFRAASQAFTKTSVMVRFEHKQLPTKCYTIYGLTTHGSDYTTYRFYLGFGLLYTIASKIHITSKEGGSEHKVMCRVNTPFSPVNVAICPALAIICSPGSLSCSSKASLHRYSERSFCGSAKRSHSCTQISWRQPRLGRLSALLHWPLVLPPAPFLWLWGYMVNRIGEDHLERGMATQPHPESIKPFGSHPVSPNLVLNLQQAEASAITFMAFSVR